MKSINKRPGPEIIKLFSCSTQLSTKFQLLIKPNIWKNNENSMVQTHSEAVFIMLTNVKRQQLSVF